VNPSVRAGHANHAGQPATERDQDEGDLAQMNTQNSYTLDLLARTRHQRLLAEAAREHAAHRAEGSLAMRKLIGMKQIVCASLVLGGLAVMVIAQSAFATPIIGVNSTSLAIGTFDSGLEANSKTDNFEVELRATGPTDVYLLQNTIAPGGTYGWHSHPGPSIVVVQSGELTLYRADDPTCTPQVYTAGSGFVDQGGDVHVVRNEGSVDAVVYVTSIIPKSAGRRIDELDPGTCGF
jgi:quercetin dioxygenase-like cupin family protein